MKAITWFPNLLIGLAALCVIVAVRSARRRLR
jgi:hypothetical protein